MKINSCQIKMAQKFLNLLKVEIKKIPGKRMLYLEAYSNGREQGYHLRCFGAGGPRKWGCSFSESRKSNGLVVYIAEGLNSFSLEGNIPNATVYEAFFQEDMQKAVVDVTKSLRTFLNVGEAQHAKV